MLKCQPVHFSQCLTNPHQLSVDIIHCFTHNTDADQHQFLIQELAFPRKSKQVYSYVTIKCNIASTLCLKLDYLWLSKCNFFGGWGGGEGGRERCTTGFSKRQPSFRPKYFIFRYPSDLTPQNLYPISDPISNQSWEFFVCTDHMHHLKWSSHYLIQ